MYTSTIAVHVCIILRFLLSNGLIAPFLITMWNHIVEIYPVTQRWAVQPLDWRRWYSKINSYVVVL